MKSSSSSFFVIYMYQFQLDMTKIYLHIQLYTSNYKHFYIIIYYLVGRPALDITRENLVVLQKKGFTAKEMAQNFGCSQSLIYTKLQTFGLQQIKKYSSRSHDELLEVVSRIHKDFPAAFEKVLKIYRIYSKKIKNIIIY